MKRMICMLLALAMLFTLAACATKQSTPDTAQTDAPVQETPAAADTAADTPAQPEEAPTQEVERYALNFAYMPNYNSMWVVMAAQNLGYFDEEGLDVTLYEFADGPTEISAMESGSIDLAYIGNGAHKLCAAGKCDIFAFSHLGDAEMVIGRTSSGIEKIEDLKGKTVGYSSGTSSETMLNLALTQAGLTMDDIVAYDMETSNMVTAMVSGTLDACSTWSPNTWQILGAMDDAVRLATPMDYIDISVAISSFIVMDSFLKEHRDVVVRFTRALMKAMDYAAPEEARQEVGEWVAKQLATDYANVEPSLHDGNYLTGKQMYEYVKDGTVEGYYETQRQELIAAGNADESTKVANYVMFDVMLEAGESLYEN